MTRLLVSVRNAAEAKAALRGGADWIDLKDPTRSSLGAVDAGVARDIVACAAGRAAISAAAGELVDWPTSQARELLQVAGISQLKLGCSECFDQNWRDAWRAAQREIADSGKELVAVIYADAAARAPAPADTIELAIKANCRWLLIDTFDKRSGTLLSSLNGDQLRAIFRQARRHGLTTAAAGRLTPEAIAELPLEAIDVIAVRSAACGGDRGASVRAERVAALRQLLHTARTV